MKYLLNPRYGDMSVVILGSSVKTILKKLKSHWEDVFEYPEEYDEELVKNVNNVLNREYKNVDELMEYYNEVIDEDYDFEEE